MTDAINKMRLCIQEMKFCKSIIDCKGEVDEWCAHLFAIYITIRMDDFTKIVGKHIPKTDGKREYFTEVLTRYNDGYRSVRDKLGAHFQNPKVKGIKFLWQIGHTISFFCLFKSNFTLIPTLKITSLLNASQYS